MSQLEFSRENIRLAKIPMEITKGILSYYKAIETDNFYKMKIQNLFVFFIHYFFIFKPAQRKAQRAYKTLENLVLLRMQLRSNIFRLEYNG